MKSLPYRKILTVSAAYVALLSLVLFARLNFFALLGANVLFATQLVLDIAMILVFLASTGLFLNALFGLFVKAERSAASREIVYYCGAILCLFAGSYFSDGLRSQYLHQVTQRAKPLISAISQFEKKEGRLPARLDELVPEFIESVPATGVAAYPLYRYCPPKSGPVWELIVPFPRSVLNRDQLVFRSDGTYPEGAFGPYVERVDDWAYVQQD